MYVVKLLLWAAGAALAMIGAAAAAQDNPQLSAYERGVVEGDEPDAAPRAKILELTGEVRLAGATADVTLEFLLGTDSPGPDEIRLDLALPRGSVVTGYALDVGGALIPGVLLEQPRARNVYEDEVRGGIDPGLAEVKAGDHFATRVFPVTPTAPRRIRVRFAAPFDPAAGLELPLRSARAIGSGRLTVTAEGLAEAPAVRFAGAAIAMTRRGDSWAGEVALDERRLDGGLAIAPVRHEHPLLLTEHAGGEAFFLIADRVEAAPPPARHGGRLRIYWDRSLSHGRDGTGREIATLVALADKTAPEAIDLVTFASDAPRVETLPGPAALRIALERVTYRGGSSLVGLDALSLPEAGQCVMVFDGQVTIDHRAEFAPDCALVPLSAASAPDSARLARLGRFVPVREGEESIVAEALARPVLQVVSARDEAGRRLAIRALPSATDGWFVAGKLDGANEVRLRVALPDGRTVQRSYLVPNAPITADAPAALWAATEIGVLQDDPTRHDELLRFARRYNVAGTRLAFLVLERPDQYISAEIAPPDGFPHAWREDYAAQKHEQELSLASAKIDRLDYVLRQWEERRAWWARTYVPARRAPAGSRGDEEGDEEEGDDEVAAPAMIAPAPPPPPPPPPSDAPAEQAAAETLEAVDAAADGYDFGDENIIVTGTRADSSSSGSDFASPTPITVGDGTEASVEMADLLGERPYLAALTAAKPGRLESALAEQQLAYGTLPGFFLDSAEWFRLNGDLAMSHLLLLSALELPEADDETRQIVAFRLERDGELDRAIELDELIAAGSQFRPQPKRALALALAERGRGAGSGGKRDLERAFALLTEVALEPAIGAFDGIEVIALMEANALIPALDAVRGEWALDPRLVGLLDTDLRVVVEWTADDADIDLWVDEPNHERVMYSHKLSTAGGQISNDMTDGYGPEEYAIRRAPRGAYRVAVNGYDADRLNPNGAGRVLVRVIRDFGRPTERMELVDAGLDFQGRDRDTEDGALSVATLQVEAAKRASGR
jgi:hypothetical protein